MIVYQYVNDFCDSCDSCMGISHATVTTVTTVTTQLKRVIFNNITKFSNITYKKWVLFYRHRSLDMDDERM